MFICLNKYQSLTIMNLDVYSLAVKQDFMNVGIKKNILFHQVFGSYSTSCTQFGGWIQLCKNDQKYLFLFYSCSMELYQFNKTRNSLNLVVWCYFSCQGTENPIGFVVGGCLLYTGNKQLLRHYLLSFFFFHHSSFTRIIIIITLHYVAGQILFANVYNL